MQLDLIVSGTTYSLTDGNPYSLESATGLAMPPVRRFARSYPGQDGYDDLGHVLEPRTITLSILFDATSHTQLDERRSTLARMFAPGTNLPLVLQVTRDDGEKRRLDVTASGLSTIELDLAHRPGRLHRAEVLLRTADPIWYSATPGTVTFGTADSSVWYLASQQIPASLVVDALTNPGTAAVTEVEERPDSIAIAFRAALSDSEDISAVAWHRTAGTISGNVSLSEVRADISGTIPVLRSAYNIYYTEKSYQISNRDNAFHTVIVNESWSSYKVFVDGVKTIDLSGYGYGIPVTGRVYWRHHKNNDRVWAGSLTHAAIYRGWLSDVQCVALHDAMGGTFGIYALTADVPYTGDYIEYPVITLTGPLANPVVRNITSDMKLDFTGSTIAAGVVYTLDLRRNVLAVIDNGGTVRTEEITDDSDIGSWALQGGFPSTLTVTATSSGTASRAEIVYRNRYVSY